MRITAVETIQTHSWNGAIKSAGTLTVPAGDDYAALELTVLRARGVEPGPHVVIFGGVHGDEFEGISAAGVIWHDLDPAALRGSVSIVSAANAPACAAATRSSPIDQLNLARTFPGRADGTVTERIAHVLAALIRQSDALIDLHSAGQHYAMPRLSGSYVADSDLGRRCEAMALAFGAPTFWAHPEISPGRSLSVALEAGIPCIYVECAGGGRVRRDDFAAYRSGVARVLAHLGLLATPPACAVPVAPRLRLRSSGDVDLALPVTRAGLLLEGAALLQRVQGDDVLGTVVDEHGAVLETLRAPAHGIVVMARRTARVQAGDGAYLLALEEDSQQ